MHNKIGFLVGMTLVVIGFFALISGNIVTAFSLGMPGALLATLFGIVWLCKKAGLKFD